MSILLDPDARPVIGHRGAAAYAPENTLVSFRRAVELGADGLELDVHLTADGHVIVMHDPRVDRTTDGTGHVQALTLPQLRALDAGARWTPDGGRTFPWRARDVRIPTLDELLEELPSVPLMIDAKTIGVAAPLARVLARHDAGRRVLVGSFHAAHLAPFAGEAWRRLATRGESVGLLVGALLHLPAHEPHYAALAIPPNLGGVPLPMSMLAHAARRRGRPVHVWTVNAAADARRLWSAGVNGLVGDDPAMLREVRADLASPA